MRRQFNHALLVGLASLWWNLPACPAQAPASPGGPGPSGSGPRRQLNSIAFGNGVFVAVGFNRTILTSRDGTNWSEHSEALEISTIGINFTTQIYSAGGQSLTLVIPNPNAGPTEVHRNPFQFRAVGFGQGKFVVVGDSGEIHESPNGENWRRAPASTSANLNGVACGLGQFVAVGDGGTILTSPDATAWKAQHSGTSNQLLAVAFGNKTFVAVGGDKDNSVILTSTNGIEWTPNEVNRLCPMGAIAFGNGKFLAAAGSGYLLAMISPDGKRWQEVAHPSSAVTGLTFGHGRFVAVDAWSQPTTSADGSEWKPPFAQREYGDFFRGAAYGNGTYVAVGTGVIAVSEDGVRWSRVASPRSKLLHGRIFDGSSLYCEDMSHSPFHSLIPPLHRVGDQTWQTVGAVAISGNLAPGETRFLRWTGSVVEFPVFYSEDGIVWTRLQPIPPSQPRPAEAPIVAPPRITSPANRPPTIEVSTVGVGFQLNGRPYNLEFPAGVGQVYELQASVDLDHWQTLTLLTNIGTGLSFMDQDVEKYPRRFYRLKLQP